MHTNNLMKCLIHFVRSYKCPKHVSKPNETLGSKMQKIKRNPKYLMPLLIVLCNSLVKGPSNFLNEKSASKLYCITQLMVYTQKDDKLAQGPFHRKIKVFNFAYHRVHNVHFMGQALQAVSEHFHVPKKVEASKRFHVPNKMEIWDHF